MARFDVVVVGAGAMGAATAWSLARRGVSVALIEQFEAGHDRGSSHGAGRIFRLAYRQPHFTRLAVESMAAWRQLSDAAGTQLVVTTGGIDHGDATTLREITSSLTAAGASHVSLSADEATERWPVLRFVTDVVHQPDAGRIAAQDVVAALHRLCTDHGTPVSYGTHVHDVRVCDDGVDVVTDDAVMTGDVVVLAVGAWLPKLGRALSLDLPPLTVTQEQPAYFPVHSDGDWPVFVHYGDVPRYGLITPGDGVKVGEHGSGVVVDPDARPDVDAARVRSLSAYVEQWVPGADATPTEVDSCLYTTTPDEEFVVKRVGRIVICSACSGHGFKFTPVIGQRAASLAIAE